MSRWLLLLAACVAPFAATNAGNGPDVFTKVVQGGDPSPADAYKGVWSVAINADELKFSPPEITLNLPDLAPVTVQLDHWEPRAGFVMEYDEEGNGHMIPDPNAKPEDFSWLWYGRGGEWTVSLTMHKGIVAGRASSAERRYGLEPRPGPVTQLGLINSSYWKTHVDDGLDNPKREAVSAAPATTASASSLGPTLAMPLPASTKGPTWDDSCAASLDTSHVNVVDVLVMYTSGYLSYAGSATQVEAQVQAGLDDANTSLRNSQMYALRFALAGVEAVPAGFNYDVSGIEASLLRLTGYTVVPPIDGYCSFSNPNTAVRNRREAKHADIVALARRDATNPPEQTCGAGWVQRVVYNNGCAMEPGADWGEKFPYFIFDPQCNSDRLNFAHEIGHTLGMEHDPQNSDVGAGGARPSCPWSFGHRRPDTGVAQSYRFRTVMAYWNNVLLSGGGVGPGACANSADCQQIDAYSNWNLQWAGPSGIQPLPLLPSSALIGVQVPWIPPSGQQPQSHAFDTMQRLGAIVADFRARPDAIFANNFQ